VGMCKETELITGFPYFVKYINRSKRREAVTSPQRRAVRGGRSTLDTVASGTGRQVGMYVCSRIVDLRIDVETLSCHLETHKTKDDAPCPDPCSGVRNRPPTYPIDHPNLGDGTSSSRPWQLLACWPPSHLTEKRRSWEDVGSDGGKDPFPRMSFQGRLTLALAVWVRLCLSVANGRYGL
jgi:hypothetical protein